MLQVVSFLALMTMYTCVLAIMATSVKRSVQLLRDQMATLHHLGIDVNATPLPAKALLFRTLQVECGSLTLVCGSPGLGLVA